MSSSEAQRFALNGNFSNKRLGEPDLLLKKTIVIADDVAQRWSSSTQWSLWHTWDYFRCRDATLDPPSAVFEAIQPFTTCVGLCLAVAKDLSERLKSMTKIEEAMGFSFFAGIEDYADKVQMLASGERDESDPVSELRPRHTAVAMFFEECCVVLDLVFSPRVFVIPANATYTTMPYVTIKGHFAKRHFHYVVNSQGQRLQMSHPKVANATKYQLLPITEEEAVKGISYPGATRTHPDSNIPTNKVVIIKGKVNEEPTKIPSMKLNDGTWMITMCRLQVDFLNRTLTIQIPFEDWLDKHRCPVYDEIQRLPMFQRMEHGVANLTVQLVPDLKEKKMDDELGHLRALGTRLGLAPVDFTRIVESVYEVWGDR